MRVFWALIGIVILLGVGFAATGQLRAGLARERSAARAEAARAEATGASARSATPGASAPMPPAPMPEATATTAPAAPAAAPMPEVASNAAPAAMPTVTAGDSAAAPAGATPATAAPIAAAPGAPTESATPTAQAELTKPEPSLDAVVQALAGTPTIPPAPPEPAPAAPAAVAATPGAGTTPEGAPAGNASAVTIEPRDDGAKIVDGRFVVKGQGTKEKPYEITWEHLVSASEVYDPRLGKKELPGRVTMLEGKWVTITGYVAFPLNVQSPRELLSMLNQWDGCCIGVPPTPYDAVEVRLARAVLEDERFATFGNVTGKFSAKPYVVGDWLVGLYLMDEAAFRATEYGGVNPNPNPEGHVPGAPR